MLIVGRVAKMERNVRRVGFSDEWAISDELGIGEYINGLGQFIARCTTPMTIAIQGDWGTGKTSMMKMVEQQLRDSVKSDNEVLCIWFNTWQFSQFNMEDDLAISLLSNMIDKLKLTKKTEELESENSLGKIETFIHSFKANKRKIGEYTRELLLMGLDATAGGRTTENIGRVCDALFGKERDDFAKQIENLKNNFQNYVNDYLNETRYTRIVVFIDDLDRLPPIKAVELLECLKLFLDCKSCIFVLAIDYEVVVSGVAEKYGNKIDYEKGRMFFDKIIQVPFKLPIREYKLENYVTKMLDTIGIRNNADIANYVGLIRTSIGTNPRSIKRIFNAYSLYLIINQKEMEKFEAADRISLFAVLVMQTIYEKAYVEFVKKAEMDVEDEFVQLIEGYKDQTLEQQGILAKNLDMPVEIVERLNLFIRELIKILQNGDTDEIRHATVKKLYKALKISSVTAVGKAAGEKGGNDILNLDEFKQAIGKELRLDSSDWPVWSYFTQLHEKNFCRLKDIRFRMSGKTITYFLDEAGVKANWFCTITIKTADELGINFYYPHPQDALVKASSELYQDYKKNNSKLMNRGKFRLTNLEGWLNPDDEPGNNNPVGTISFTKINKQEQVDYLGIYIDDLYNFKLG